MNLQIALLISKDPQLRQLVEAAAPQISIQAASTIAEGLSCWSETSPLLVISEGTPPTLEPLFEYAKQLPSAPPVLVIGDHHSVKDAVDIMRAGAADYLTKPVSPADLQAAINGIIRQSPPVTSTALQDPFAAIVSISPQMNLMKHLATGELLGELDEELASGTVVELREKFSVVELQSIAPGAEIRIKDRVVVR